MRKGTGWALLGMLFLAPALDLRGASLAGVSLPDAQEVQGTKLVLNGLGLRTKYMIKVYVAGLYLQRKSADPQAIIAANEPKRVVMQFLHGVSKGRMADAFDDSFNANSPDAKRTMKAEIDRLLGALEPMAAGGQMVFTYVPATGTTFTVNGKDRLTVPGLAFAQVIFAVWLGPEPPTPELKKGMLGQ